MVGVRSDTTSMAMPSGTSFCNEGSKRRTVPVGRQALEWASLNPLITSLTWRAEHLSDGRPFEAWLVAPATANTIAKLAAGIADTVVSAALASALGRLGQGLTQVLVAPTMHGSLHTPILERNCRALAELGVTFIPPRDAYGKHNLPDVELLVAAVCRALSTSALRGRRLLVTGGPTPVAIDAVRRLVNRFSGRLGAAITAELVLRGAQVRFVLGDGGWRPPSWLPCTIAANYDEYKRLTLAAVADELPPGACGSPLQAFKAKVGREIPVARILQGIVAGLLLPVGHQGAVAALGGVVAPGLMGVIDHQQHT